jgi:23S rRNA (guanine745-N1)-methyltransferase
MQAEIIAALACPVCGAGLATAGASLRCPRGHAFDVARQGYVNLIAGRAPTTGETPAMVAARAEFLGAGHYAPLVDAVAVRASTAAGTEGMVVDAGAGTGHYLSAVLDRLPGRYGIAVDAAKAAARFAARAHPRAAAVVADVWRGLPVLMGTAAVVLNVFAPRNADEFARALRPEGTLIVVTPRADHLASLVRPLGLLRVDPAKDLRLDAALGRRFHLAETHRYGFDLALDHAAAGQAIAMGPSAWHVEPEALAERLADLPDPITTRVSVTLRLYHPRPSAPIMTARS